MENYPKPEESNNPPEPPVNNPAPMPPEAPLPPPPPPAAPPTKGNHQENAWSIILGWLTYAFWGWTVLSLSFLTTMVIANFVNGETDNEFIPYAIAAIVVLLPISVICDYFFSKQEENKKTGAALAVMVIHAVIFALFAIGSLIAAVFSVVNMLTDSSDTDGAQVALYSALIIFVMYSAVLLRTLNPPQLPWVKRFFKMFMIVTVGVICLLGIIGPAANARQTRDDRLIEENLTYIKTNIDDYARANDRLPGSLNDLELDGNEEKLVDKGLVEYSPNTKQPKMLQPMSSRDADATMNQYYQDFPQQQTFYYTLCVNFKKASKKDNYYGYEDRYSDRDEDGYKEDLLNIYSHSAGETCYKLKTLDY